MGQAEFILILQKGDTHIFFEKAAEVCRLKRRDISNVLNRNGLVIVLRSVVQNRCEPGQHLTLMVKIGLHNLHGKTLVKLENGIIEQTVKPQKIPVRSGVIHLLHLLQRCFESIYFFFLNWLQIFCVIEKKEHLADIGHQCPDKADRNLKHNRYIWRGASGGVNHVGIYQNHLPGVQNPDVSLDGKGQFPFLQTDQFNGIMPVRWYIAAGINGSVKPDFGSRLDRNHLIAGLLCINSHKNPLHNQKEFYDFTIPAFPPLRKEKIISTYLLQNIVPVAND